MDGLGKKFIEMTKFQHLEKSDQMNGKQAPPLELEYDRGKEMIPLPDHRAIHLKNKNLREVIENRRSIRSYSPELLSLEELSFLLWCTQGVEEVIPPHGTMRTVPSAGARHALETFLLVNRVNGLQQGLYRFLAVDHHLIKLDMNADIGARVTKGCLDQQFVKTSCVTFIWIALPYRMTWRYGERGYRYLYLDAGHACQNLYLSAESIDCGVCAVGAFLDDEMNRCLNLDGEEAFVIYMAALGKKMS